MLRDDGLGPRMRRAVVLGKSNSPAIDQRSGDGQAVTCELLRKSRENEITTATAVDFLHDARDYIDDIR